MGGITSGLSGLLGANPVADKLLDASPIASTLGLGKDESKKKKNARQASLLTPKPSPSSINKII